MLKGLLLVVYFAAAYGVLRVVYGNEGVEVRMARKKKSTWVLISLIAFVLVFWSLSLMFLILGEAGQDAALCVFIAGAVPVAIVIWTVIARKNKNGDFQQSDTGETVRPTLTNEEKKTDNTSDARV